MIEFDAIRAACPALKYVLVPDAVWNDYRKFCAGQDEACHQAITYLAFERRHLARLTRPIHAYCLNGSDVRSDLTAQYKNDLVENWMFKNDVKGRFESARRFKGRLKELLFAQWLAGEGWHVQGLEAWGAAVDVEACSSQGALVSFEVKYIGESEVSFDLGVQALRANGVSVGSLPVYSPVDYMLYRIFEAARQLKNAPHLKVVVVILHDFETSYNRPISQGWINWSAPAFLRRNSDIEPFLQAKYSENPGLDGDLRTCICRLNEIWFFDTPNPLTIRKREVRVLSDAGNTASDCGGL